MFVFFGRFRFLYFAFRVLALLVQGLRNFLVRCIAVYVLIIVFCCFFLSSFGFFAICIFRFLFICAGPPPLSFVAFLFVG